MRFEARDLKPYAEPVSSSELEAGHTYFSVQFIDEEMLIPRLDPLVFLGRDLLPGDAGLLYFQDADSHRAGIQLEGRNARAGQFYAQPDTEIQHVFSFEQALDLLLSCSLRRRGRPPERSG